VQYMNKKSQQVSNDLLVSHDVSQMLKEPGSKYYLSNSI
jgi:hypothetical protein